MRASAAAMFFLLGAMMFVIPVSANVIIHEIYPWGSGGEWVEMYNDGDEPAIVGGWIIETLASQKDAILPENSTIPAKGFFAVGDNLSGNDFNETITISDTAVFVALRNAENQTVDSVNLSGFFKREDALSIQRKSWDISLSSETSNWLLASPTKDSDNFPAGPLIEISEVSCQKEAYANETIFVNATVSNNGLEDASGVSLSLNSSFGFSESVYIDVPRGGFEKISFGLPLENTGNFSICVFLENASICRDILVKPRPQKTATIKVELNDRLMTYREYSSLFKIEIENKSLLEGNCNGKDMVFVSFIINESSGLRNFSGSFIADVGCSKISGNGQWTATKGGNYTICGWIVNSTSGFDSTKACKNISVASMEEIPCNLTMVLESKNSLADGEPDPFNITVSDNLGLCKDCPAEITYSIQDSSGNFISGYPKITNKTVGEKTGFSFTPNLNCGTAVYRLKVTVSKAFCNDSSLEDNSAERMINITGETTACPAAQTKKAVKKTVASTGGGGGDSVPATTAKSDSDPILVEIAYLRDEVSAGEEFLSRLSIRNNGNISATVDVYSYAYDGKKCITGGWTKNLLQVSIPKREIREVSLKNEIAEGTQAGDYIFRARVKLDGKNFDTDGSIKVADGESFYEVNKSGAQSAENGEGASQENKNKPDLKIWSDTKLRINLSNCEGCTMEITGPNINTTTDKKYRVFDLEGGYKVIVLRGNETILNRSYDFTKAAAQEEKALEGITESSTEEENEDFEDASNAPTGNFVKSNPQDGVFSRIISFLRGLLSPILNLMDSSISR
jgi:hypothetical protein